MTFWKNFVIFCSSLEWSNKMYGELGKTCRMHGRVEKYTEKTLTIRHET
jgi:hypothetical protein